MSESEFSPVDALRMIRQVLSDADLGSAAKCAVIGVILRASYKTRIAWADYRALRAEFGISNDAIRAGLSKALGKYFEKARKGARGAVAYKMLALRSPERSEANPRSHLAGVSAPIPSAQRSDRRSDSCPSSSPLSHPSCDDEMPSSRRNRSEDRKIDVDQLLKDLEVRDPIRSKLAADPRVTPARVRRAAKAAERANNRPGYVVRILQAGETLLPKNPSPKEAAELANGGLLDSIDGWPVGPPRHVGHNGRGVYICRDYAAFQRIAGGDTVAPSASHFRGDGLIKFVDAGRLKEPGVLA